ncbi:hypothetical protein [Adonisia turfae]|nr:hypothetical protein [Adonisia turfae]
MIVLSSMKAMRTRRTELLASLVLSLWHKLRPEQGCEADCC